MLVDLNTENLKCLIIEIIKLRSKSLILGTWYRPQNIISKLDSENSEMCILGARVHEPISANPLKLNCILYIYIIDQLINEPTRITNDF